MNRSWEIPFGDQVVDCALTEIVTLPNIGKPDEFCRHVSCPLTRWNSRQSFVTTSRDLNESGLGRHNSARPAPKKRRKLNRLSGKCGFANFCGTTVASDFRTSESASCSRADSCGNYRGSPLKKLTLPRNQIGFHIRPWIQGRHFFLAPSWARDLPKAPLYGIGMKYYASPPFRVTDCIVRHTWLRQTTFRRAIAIDPAFGSFGPTNIERPVLREEIQRRVGKVVVYPSCQPLPIALSLEPVPEAWHYNAGSSSHLAVFVAHIPDVAAVIFFIRSACIPGLAFILHHVAKSIDLRRTKRRPNRNAPKRVLEGLKQFVTELSSCRNSESGSSGTFSKPCNMAISEYRKSRMKNDLDNCTRPSSVSADTVLGLRINCLVPSGSEPI